MELSGHFYGHLLTEPVDGNAWRQWQISGMEFGLLVYIPSEKGDTIVDVRPQDGFYFDYASIPPPASWIYPKTGGGSPDEKYAQAANIHDWLYTYPDKAAIVVDSPKLRRGSHYSVDRLLADRIFLLGMELYSVRPTLRGLFYSAVRVGGGRVFGKPNKLNKLRGV